MWAKGGWYIRLKIPHCSIVARPVIISKENSRDELDEELTARSCCGLFYIFLYKFTVSVNR